MKRLWMVAVLVLACTLAGCGSKTEDKAQINATLDRLAAAYKARSPSQIADAYSYPCKSVVKNGSESVISTREDMVAMMTLLFLFIEDIHDYRIENHSVAVSGSDATVRADLLVDATSFGYREQSTTRMEYTLRKSDGWKIVVQRELP
jgi:ketosteroid isomerase-like protein